MLRLHAVNVIDEYGPLWLAHEAQDPNLCDEDIRESLAHIPEDIEAMADLLDATLEDLSETHSILAILCDILSLQAHMHKELAAIELSGLSLTPPQNETKGTVQVQKLDDNILVFPSQSAANSGEYVSS